MKWKIGLQSILVSLFIFLAIGAFLRWQGKQVFAATIDELKSKISDRNQNIKDLEKEIANYEAEITQTQKESKSLQSTIKQLDLTRKKLLADIAVTENKISSATDRLAELGIEIVDKETRIESNLDAVGESLRRINEVDSTSLVETILRNDTLSEFWNDVENIKSLERAIRERTRELENLKSNLVDQQTETEQKKRELEFLRATLSDQKKIVEQNTQEKNKLLSDTKNKETAYQKTLAQKKILKEAFEKELLQFQSELQFTYDPASMPHPGSGILEWPLLKVLITQPFGDTAFSREHPTLYSGSGHNGIDLAASVGTPIRVAASGTVEGTGDTDTVCPGASYGKWVFVRHANGLATLYAHLSLIKASIGENVSTGDIIGYSGSTGYATGPHLHFTVYASTGVKVLDRKSKVCGGTYRIPIADIKAYLNPLLYL